MLDWILEFLWQWVGSTLRKMILGNTISNALYIDGMIGQLEILSYSMIFLCFNGPIQSQLEYECMNLLLSFLWQYCTLPLPKYTTFLLLKLNLRLLIWKQWGNEQGLFHKQLYLRLFRLTANEKSANWFDKWLEAKSYTLNSLPQWFNVDHRKINNSVLNYADAARPHVLLSI